MKLSFAKPKRVVAGLCPPVDADADAGEPEAKRAKGAAASPPAAPLDPAAAAQIERTASFTAELGVGGNRFEERTRQSTRKDPLFAFLHDVESPEHAYYQSRVVALRAAREGAASAAPAAPVASAPPPASDTLQRDTLQELQLWERRAALEAAQRRPQFAERPPEADVLPPPPPLAPLVPLPPPPPLPMPTADGSLPEHNRGHKMLKALGWSEGSGLGLSGDGRTVPVGVDSVAQNAGQRPALGLGASDADPFAEFRKRESASHKEAARSWAGRDWREGWEPR